MKRICLILATLLLMCSSELALGDSSITEDELGIFSCLYMAQNVVSGMSQLEYADIGNNQPIRFVNYETGWSVEDEPILDIYFTEHFYLSFWGEPVAHLLLNLDGVILPSSPIIEFLIPKETESFSFPAIDEGNIQPNTYLEKASIHKRELSSTISQSEYELLSAFLACAHLSPDMTPEEFIKTVTDNEVPFVQCETSRKDEETITTICFSDKLSLKLVSKGNIESAFLSFTYFDGAEEYCASVSVDLENNYFHYFDSLWVDFPQ